MRISLRLKLILSRILPILIILPLFAFYLTATLRTYYINQLKAGMLQTGELVTDALTRSGWQDAYYILSLQSAGDDGPLSRPERVFAKDIPQ